MSSGSTGRELRIFCPVHKTSFTVNSVGTLICASGGDLLAQDFPYDEFWEYCCDCQHYFPAEIIKSNKSREQCPICDRATIRRYVCDRCKLISFEGDETVLRKAFDINAAGAVEPGCPGCLSPSRPKLRAHACDESQFSFYTARPACPFCGEPIGDPPSFPTSVADFLGKIASKKIEVALDSQRSLLAPSEKGDFVLVSGNNGMGLSIVVPRRTRFESKQDYYTYESFYHCDDVSAGEVWVVHPAVVDKTEEGWKLREIGRLEIKRETVAEPIPKPPEKPPAEIRFCPQCGAQKKADHLFCGDCGHNFPAPENATVAEINDQTDSPTNAGSEILTGDPYLAAITQPLTPPGTPVTAAKTEVKLGSSGKRAGIVVAFVVLLIAALIGIVAVNSSRNSAENRLERAIAAGNLVSPSGASAYDYYRQLKSEGASPAVISGFEDRLMPLLTEQPKQLLVEFAKPGSQDPSIPEWERAQRLLSWASEIKPNDTTIAARAAYCTGRIAYKDDRKDDALTDWKKASELDKTWGLAVNGVGLIYNERKEYDTARPYLREAVKRDPNWAVPYNNLGTSYYFQQRYDEAEGYYEKAVALAPNWARPHAWLGDIALTRRDYPRVIQEYQTVLDSSSVGTSTMDLPAIRRKLEKVRQMAGQQ